MIDQQRIALRAAARIRQGLLLPGQNAPDGRLGDISWEECTKLTRHLETVQERGWHTAATHVRNQLRFAVQTVRGRLDEALNLLEREPPRLVATQRDIYEDILAIYEDFEDVELNLKKRQVSVKTRAIELEGIHLGPFRIVLDWRMIAEGDAYEVIAVDPQPAATSSDTTHPHVSANRLCEGEAKLPIRRALQQGRLLDFFTIVRQTLESYNASSAYVRLDEWQGTDCQDCGARVDDEGRFTCEKVQR